MVRTALVVALLALSTPVLAQRAAFSFDLRQVGAIDAVPIDDDQNPYTRAWVLHLEDGARFRLVVAKPGGFCFEDPFTVAGATGESTMTTVKEGSQEMLKVSPRKGVEVIVNPDTGLWEIVVPTYAPIPMVRVKCADRR